MIKQCNLRVVVHDRPQRGHQLADCLAPIAGLFDEIVVVDTGSRDATQNIARRSRRTFSTLPGATIFLPPAMRVFATLMATGFFGSMPTIALRH